MKSLRSKALMASSRWRMLIPHSDRTASSLHPTETALTCPACIDAPSFMANRTFTVSNPPPPFGFPSSDLPSACTIAMPMMLRASV